MRKKKILQKKKIFIVKKEKKNIKKRKKKKKKKKKDLVQDLVLLERENAQGLLDENSLFQDHSLITLKNVKKIDIVPDHEVPGKRNVKIKKENIIKKIEKNQDQDQNKNPKKK